MGKTPATPTPRAPAAPFTQAQVDAAARVTADAGSTPSVVLDAFMPTPITVGKITIPPFRLGKYLLLERLKSPLVRDDAREITNDQVLEAVFAMATPTPQVLALLARDNAKLALTEAIWEFADTIPLADLAALGAAIQTQMQRAKATLVGESSESPVSPVEGAAAEPAEKKSGPAAATSPALPPKTTG
jgi:hypothetical protein